MCLRQFHYAGTDIFISPIAIRSLAKYLDKKHFSGFELRPLVFEVMAHERTHHFQDNSKMEGMWWRYLHDRGEASNAAVTSPETERRISAFGEDQADYFAGMFVNFCVKKGILHESAREFISKLYSELGSDKDIARALRSHPGAKQFCMRTPDDSKRIRGGHAQGVFRAQLFEHTTDVNDSNFAEFAKYGVYESWK